MSLIQLIVFSTAGILIGAIKTPAVRIRIIFFFSALAIYWLQPPSAIRYLEFWFPTLTIALVILVYTICFPDSIRNRQNLADLGILTAAWLVVGLLRYLGVSLTSTNPPQIITIAVYSIVLLTAAAALSLLKVKRVLNLAFIALILAVFLFLKNEHLVQLASVWLRRWTGQDPALARSLYARYVGS